MIPKTIHYCWFGGNPKSDVINQCIDSWKQLCPEYEIIEWNEENFDINICNYTKEAYGAKKWAFVSDYARIWILYNYGGVYLDTDVKLLKNLDDLLDNRAFMGVEAGGGVNTGLIVGSEKNINFFDELLCMYNKTSFVDSDGKLNLTSCVEYTTNILEKYGLSKDDKIQEIIGLTIYPMEYFSPLNHITGKVNITENSYSIHLYEGTWADDITRYGYKLKWKYIERFGEVLGKKLYLFPYFGYILKNKGLKGVIQKVKSKLNGQ